MTRHLHIQKLRAAVGHEKKVARDIGGRRTAASGALPAAAAVRAGRAPVAPLVQARPLGSRDSPTRRPPLAALSNAGKVAGLVSSRRRS